MVMRLSGLASGLDTESIIKTLVEAKQMPITRMEEEIDDDTLKYNAWTELDTELTSLRSITSQLSSYTTWRQKTTSAVDSNGDASTAVTATADTTASAGNYDIVVSQLAKSHRIAGEAQTDTTSDLNLTGDFTVGGELITVEATDSLEDIRDKINQAALDMDAEEKVNASIIGTTLVLERDLTGDTDITISDGTNNILQSGAGGLGIFTGTVASPTAVLNDELQTSEDLAANINGIDITSSSNTNVTNAVSGLTLNFSHADPAETITLSVKNDTSTIKTLINDFITKYNETMELVKNQGTVVLSTEGDVSGVGYLQGEFLISDIQTKGRSILTSVETNPGIMDQDYNTLYKIGIWTTGEDNVFSIVDEDKLDNALENHFEEIEDLFRDSSSGILRNFDDYLYDNLIDPIEGAVTLRKNSILDEINAKETSIAEMKVDLYDYEVDLWDHFARMEGAVNDMQSQANYMMSSLGMN